MPPSAPDPPVEDQRDLIGAAQVQVVADDLFEEDPPAHRAVQHLGQRELRLQDRDVVAVARGPVGRRVRVRHPGQPLAQQGVDLGRSQGGADRLHTVDVAGLVERGEGVVQRGEPDPRLGSLPLGPLVAVEAQLGVVGEVGTELEEERTEVGVDGIDVEVVDEPGGLHDPRIRPALGVTALLGAKQRRLLLRTADEQHPLGPARCLEPGQVLVHHVVLTLPLDEVDPGDALIDRIPAHRGAERVGDLAQRRGRGDRQSQLPVDVTHDPSRILQLRDVDVEIHPVDALDLEDGVLGDDIGHSAR